MTGHSPPTEVQVQAVLDRLPPACFLANFVRWCALTSDAPLVFALFSGLQALEAVAGGLELESFAERRATNLYTALIGASGGTRKSWVLARTRRMILEAKIAADNPGVPWNAVTEWAGLVARGGSIPAGGVPPAPAPAGAPKLPPVGATGKKARKARKAAKKARKAAAAAAAPPPVASVAPVAPSDEPPDMNPWGFLRSPATHQSIKWALSTLEDPLRKTLIVYAEGDVFFSQLAEDRRYKAFYMDAYDGGDLSDMTKGAAHRVILPSARLSLTLGATPEHIREFMDAGAWLQGMAGRFLWAYGVQERRRGSWTRTPQSDQRWHTARQALRIHALSPPSAAKPVTLQGAAQAALSAYEQRSGEEMTGLEAVVTSRRRQHAEKIACLIALDRGSPVNKACAEIAVEIVKLAVSGTLALYEGCPNSKRDREYGAVRDAMQELAQTEVDSKGVLLTGRPDPVFTQAEVYAAVGKTERVSWRQLDEILAEMDHAGLIRFKSAYANPAKAHRAGLAQHAKDGTDRIVWTGARRRVVVDDGGV